MSPKGARPEPAADILAAVRACRLWHAATDAGVARLASSARVQRAERGAVLMTEGQLSEEFAVVVAGKVSVHHLAANGRKIRLESAGPGEPVAAVAALAGVRAPAFAETVTPAVLAWLPVSAVFDLMAAEPVVALELVRTLARRVVEMTGVVQSFALDVPQRLARYLFQRSLASGRTVADGLLVTLDMSKTELAAALGTVPETLSRALSRLKSDGIAETRGRDVLVRDVGALARLGAGYEEG
jgi:CRP-like cAMP-binding protein